MKVLNLRCAAGHGFEGWFGSEGDFAQQQSRGLLSCPMCGEAKVDRLPSAPRLNLSGAKAPKIETGRAPSAAGKPAVPAVPVVPPQAADLQALQAALVGAMQQVMRQTEDVGDRFPEEARRIHYGETEARGIRGQATPEERAALSEEGIEVMTLPLPVPKGSAH